MNILVIGNGFDLAHGLPTRYTDFLEFVKVIRQVVNIKSRKDLNKLTWGKIHIKIREIIEINMENTRNNLFSQKAVWEDLIAENYWIEYFLQCDMYQKENWIDFEKEISRVIKFLNEIIRVSSSRDTIEHLSDQFLNKILNNLQLKVTCGELRDRLLNDLNKFIRAFEIYLAEYVEKINIEIFSPDIKDVVVKIYEDKGKKGAIFTKVLSFNYTNIYEKMYLKKYDANVIDCIDYIHGKADINNSIETNNMVLGIDEYLEDDRKDKEVDFIAFKKFYQRIYKQTGCKYKEWIDKIKNEDNKNRDEMILLREKIDEYESKNKAASEIGKCKHKLKEMRHNLYIFGHSLDVTDKDVFRELILNDNVYTTIFYPDKDELGRKIANLVKVIGQDELIKRTGGRTKTIEFKRQEPMIERES